MLGIYAFSFDDFFSKQFSNHAEIFDRNTRVKSSN